MKARCYDVDGCANTITTRLKDCMNDLIKDL
uniref:Uncharacterized protein n=1 Tax=Rhizophora mucronata TaxID=61149 RepID=A0A2P2PT63_RHIMU